MSRSKHPVKEREVERLAREALELHFHMQSPNTPVSTLVGHTLMEHQIDEALSLYAKTFGYGACMVFTQRTLAELSEQAWAKAPSVS